MWNYLWHSWDKWSGVRASIFSKLLDKLNHILPYKNTTEIWLQLTWDWQAMPFAWLSRPGWSHDTSHRGLGCHHDKMLLSLPPYASSHRDMSLMLLLETCPMSHNNTGGSTMEPEANPLGSYHHTWNTLKFWKEKITGSHRFGAKFCQLHKTYDQLVLK